MLFVTDKELYVMSYFTNAMTLMILKLRVLIEHYNKNRSKIAKKKKNAEEEIENLGLDIDYILL